MIDPGKEPEKNLQFQVFLAAILESVDNHAALLRLSASSAGNDHRLGANEAPPAIISAYLGDQLADVVDQIIATVHHHLRLPVISSSSVWLVVHSVLHSQ